jgi:hypothetical protein
MGPRYSSAIARVQKVHAITEDLSESGVPKDAAKDAAYLLYPLVYSDRQRIIQSIKNGEISAGVDEVRKKIQAIEKEGRDK